MLTGPNERRLRGLVDEAELLAEAIVDTVVDSVLLLDDEFRVQLANRSFYVTFQGQPADTLDRYVYELGNGQWNIPALRDLLGGILPQNGAIENYDVEHEFVGIGRKIMRLNARKLRRRSDQRDLILLIIRDVTEMDRTKEELRTLAAHLLNLQDSERQRIASELHDDLAQRLAGLDMGLDHLGTLISASPEQVGAELERLRAQAGRVTDDLRQICHRLHPAALEHLGLDVSLRELVEDFARHWPASVDYAAHSLPERVPLNVATALYRIVQEALSNIARHAPGAQVAVLLTGADGVFELTVEDTGPGFEPRRLRTRRGLGLASMEARARSLGGSLVLHSTPGSGTKVLSRVPCSDQPK